MKFSDGYWAWQPGVEALQPREVFDVQQRDGGVTVHASTAPLVHRGATLNRPTISASFDAVTDGVIRVRLWHFDGAEGRGPAFDLHEDGVDAQVSVTGGPGDGSAVVQAGDALSVTVSLGQGWQVDFTGAVGPLTSSTARSVAALTTRDGTFVREQLSLGVGEHIFGLGERFGPLVKNGQVVDIWNADGGTCSEQAYKNVPFYLSDKGYGVFVDDPRGVSFEVGSEVVSQCQFSVPGESLTYYVIAGPGPKEVLDRYTALTGRPGVVPAWASGLWLSTSFTTDYDEATVTSFVDGMAERDIPLSVFHFDCFWMRRFRWCDFVWDPVTFPDPEGMLRRLKDRGLRVCVWINPYIAQRSELFAEGAKAGYLVRRPDGTVWQWDMWQAGMGLVDFTNPEASAWFAGKLEALLEMGVDCFKTDFGERIPTDVVWHDGSDPQGMHNYYTHLYNRCVFSLLERTRGEGEAVLFARSATAGGQQFPVHWGGDCASTFVSMAESLRGGLSLAMSGFAFWSHDIGGFEGTPDPAVFKRWLAFGLLSSHSRLHGSTSYRVPWAFDDEAVDVARTFTKLKLRLMPYLQMLAREAHVHGTPVMRPMALEFPGDRSAVEVDTQYMLGPSLLVAPVFSAEGDVEYYLPNGTWRHALTGDAVEGDGWQRETHGFDSLPLLVRPGTVLPIGSTDHSPEYDYADGIELRLYDLPEGYAQDLVIPAGTGASDVTFSVRRHGDTVTIGSSGRDVPWSARWMDASGDAARAVDGKVTLDIR